jgi:tRNA(Ile)-lysidine synthase
MTTDQSFQHFVGRNRLWQPDDHLLLAVSGGVDSTVLCALCYHFGYSFTIAHVNFRLRGTDSDEDALFVQALATQYQVPYVETSFDTKAWAEAHKMGIQEAARALRYQWFRQLQADWMQANPGKRCVLVTAHHADDAVETMLMHFFRGTGIQGIAGIPMKAGKPYPLARPLLFASKTDLLQYASAHSIAFREDASNAHTDYTRNAVRLQLMPVLKAIFPTVEQNLRHNLARFQDAALLTQSALEKICQKLTVTEKDCMKIPVLRLQQLETPATVLHHLLQPVGFTAAQLPDALQLLQAETGKYIVSPTHRLLRNRAWLMLTPLTNAAEAVYIIEAGEQAVAFPKGEIRLQQMDKPDAVDTERPVALLDEREIVYPLLLRKWKTGDYFYPLGMPKKKKLSRFFIDLKLSLADKEQVWVIESNKRIAWVVGLRIDDRFKIRSATTRVLQLTWKPA